MAQFSSIADFRGFYTGSYDVRRAELEIVVGFTTGQPIDFAMKFVDLDRNLEYSAGFRLSPQDNNTHVLRDIILHSSGQADIYWSRLHLHTWNTNFLSGVSIWNKEEYGMSFSRPSQ